MSRNLYDDFSPEYMKIVNEEFDRVTRLLDCLRIEDALNDIPATVQMSNHRLHLASIQMANEKREKKREEDKEKGTQTTLTFEKTGETVNLKETIEKDSFKNTPGITNEQLEQCNKAIKESTPINILGQSKPYYVSGGVDTRVSFDGKIRYIVQAVTFDGEGNGELLVVGHPGQEEVDALSDKDGELLVEIWDENDKKTITAFRSIVRTSKPIWDVSIDDIVIETRFMFHVINTGE